MESALVPKTEGTYDAETGLLVPQAAIWMVFITIFMDTLAATISTPALPYYARSFHISNAAIGYLYASWSFTSAFCAPVLGKLSDQVGRRKVLIASLVGAGIANLGQACAGNYYELLAWRAFSGVWAAVGNSAQVYLSDVCSPAVLPDYMSKLSAVPSLAMTFGPGLGGGLSKFGLSIPVLVDGLLSLAAAGLCYIYLPESPSWVADRENPKTATVEASSSSSADVPPSVKVLAFSAVFQGIAFGTAVSMTAITLDAKLGFDSLHVGFTFVLAALATLATSIWGTSRVQQRAGLKNTAVLGSLFGGAFSLLMAVVPGVWTTVTFLCLSRVGVSLRGGSSGTILTKFTNPSNRGSVFAMQQFALNIGRLLGPVIAGHLAVQDPITLPWLFSAVCSLISALILLAVQMPDLPEPQQSVSKMVRGFTDLKGAADSLELEYGSAEDCKALGEYVGGLLTKRRYRWVSRREAIYSMLDKLLPELSSGACDHVQDLERLMKHVEQMQKDFQNVQSRDC
ncbi:tetA [Symbiodinium sp. CCMP2456]|nr:tetA [Symbiodinium sp. CCMP2456]